MPKTTPRQPNCRSSLAARRRTQDPMAAYDRLPPELRGWLAQRHCLGPHALPCGRGSAPCSGSVAIRMPQNNTYPAVSATR
tara:strand:+ start:526 stop:768 length:243 start_codon:yes stop_codon:yes gene_type:complete